MQPSLKRACVYSDREKQRQTDRQRESPDVSLKNPEVMTVFGFLLPCMGLTSLSVGTEVETLPSVGETRLAPLADGSLVQK